MSDFDQLVYLDFIDVAGYLKDALKNYGYGDTTMPTFHPGPPDGDALKTSPGALVFLAVGGGPGLSREDSFDRQIITTRVVGEQSNHDNGKRLAMAVDRALLAFAGADDLGSVYALGITRTGGGPTLLLKDSGERYHFPCSYVTETETGL